ncbi:hypothetical protein BDP27DRAFT_1432536 [Rhodocollybia butyracea]|uniref:Uncharacterized protein n=1 Tax=Rhodocollybia butyracea TaxID=206335 RepID=A0A9P5TWN9_9AGAR|nr:hypothetical protein BDP27DRAFT_1432536 [Rhodocollybia butyracea]
MLSAMTSTMTSTSASTSSPSNSASAMLQQRQQQQQYNATMGAWMPPLSGGQRMRLPERGEGIGMGGSMGGGSMERLSTMNDER